MLYQLSYSRLYRYFFGCGGWNWTTYLRVMSPTRYRFSTPHLQTGEPGFEPGQTESKSGVLPLDDSPITVWRLILYFFSSIFQEKIKKNIKKDKNQISTIIFIYTSRQSPPLKKYHFTFLLDKNIASCFFIS